MTEQIYPEPACECSAGLDEGQIRCRKCRARDRWIKKQAAKRREGVRREETRRPPRGPRRMAMSGVTWT